MQSTHNDIRKENTNGTLTLVNKLYSNQLWYQPHAPSYPPISVINFTSSYSPSASILPFATPEHSQQHQYNSFGPFCTNMTHLHENGVASQTTSFADFQQVVDNYLKSLSPRKRDKALIDRSLYSLIQQVLLEPRNTSISTAQFRFWVKRMFHYRSQEHTFTLLHPNFLSSSSSSSSSMSTSSASTSSNQCMADRYCCWCCFCSPLLQQQQQQYSTHNITIYHDDRPVALKEQLYDILVKAHHGAEHGGRDKTASFVRNQYSWIPKELVASFVRLCPVCIGKRRTSHSSSSSSSGSDNSSNEH